MGGQTHKLEEFGHRSKDIEALPADRAGSAHDDYALSHLAEESHEKGQAVEYRRCEQKAVEGVEEAAPARHRVP